MRGTLVYPPCVVWAPRTLNPTPVTGQLGHISAFTILCEFFSNVLAPLHVYIQGPQASGALRGSGAGWVQWGLSCAPAADSVCCCSACFHWPCERIHGHTLTNTFQANSQTIHIRKQSYKTDTKDVYICNFFMFFFFSLILCINSLHVTPPEHYCTCWKNAEKEVGACND